MRFITEFEIVPPYTKAGLDSCKGYSNLELGAEISALFGWEERGETTLHGPVKERFTLEIEAFPMEKWIEFKNKLFSYLENSEDGVSPLYILEMIKDLEFYSNNKQAVDKLTNPKQQVKEVKYDNTI